MRPTRTFILIADAARARVLRNDGPGTGLQPVPGMTFAHHIPPTHELVPDRQPRSVESVGGARHAIEGRIDPHRKEKQKFIEELAGALAHAVDKGEFDALVVVAPPQALGDLRAAMTERTRKLVVKEIAHDLTKTPEAELAGHLRGVVTL